MMRLRAIGCALWYGIMPWWIYESECHYPGMSYREHLVMNLQLAMRWACWAETKADRVFEQQVNGNNRPI